MIEKGIEVKGQKAKANGSRRTTKGIRYRDEGKRLKLRGRSAGMFFRMLGICLIDAFTTDMGKLPAFDNHFGQCEHAVMACCHMTGHHTNEPVFTRTYFGPIFFRTAFNSKLVERSLKREGGYSY